MRWAFIGSIHLLYLVVLKLLAMPSVQLSSFFLLKYEMELQFSKIVFSTFELLSAR